MTTKTLTSIDDTIRELPGYMASVMYYRDHFTVSGYVGNDILSDVRVSVDDPTVSGAIRKYIAAYEEALGAKPVLKTASAVKAAVVELIREHGAAPAEFRDAVDALRVGR